MIFSTADLPYLKRSLYGLACGLTLCGSAIWLGNSHLDHAREQLHEAQMRLDKAKQVLAVAQNDSVNLTRYASEYSSIQERKIITEEQRLSWMEDIKRLERQHHLSGLKYTIAPQRVLPHKTGNTDIDVRLSELSLQTNLLHEMRLIDFIRDLHTESAGNFIIERCSLERASTDETSPPEDSRALLKAECIGGWITLKHRGTP